MRIIKRKQIVDPNARVNLFNIIFSSCFFVGYIPVASGTFGSIFAILFFLYSDFQKMEIIIPATLICFAIGIFSSKSLITKYGDDPSVVVIDEVVGMWVTIIVFVLLGNIVLSNFYLLVCFIFFRFFDVIKIQPAKFFDNLANGFGIMMDDVVAGIYAGIAACLVALSGFNPF